MAKTPQINFVFACCKNAQIGLHFLSIFYSLIRVKKDYDPFLIKLILSEVVFQHSFRSATVILVIGRVARWVCEKCDQNVHGPTHSLAKLICK
jgi:hypothetical protein